MIIYNFYCFFFFNDTETTEIYTYLHTLSLHDALPICLHRSGFRSRKRLVDAIDEALARAVGGGLVALGQRGADRHRLVRSELLDRRFAKTDIADLFANFVDRRHRAGEFDAHRLADDEIDAQVQAAHRDQRDRGDDHQHADRHRDVAPFEEVDVRVVGDEFQQTHGFGPFLRC